MMKEFINDFFLLIYFGFSGVWSYNLYVFVYLDMDKDIYWYVLKVGKWFRCELVFF